MKKRMVSFLLMLAIMVSLSPAAFAAEKGSAEDLLGGGYICLTRNVHLKNQVPLEQDTVLDLNGYTIDGDSISVPEGVTLFLKNGTMKGSILNSGECRIENVSFFRGRIKNEGYISLIRDCSIEHRSYCIYNSDGGVIDLIENCDIKSTEDDAVYCHGREEISRIECIRNSFLHSSEKGALSDLGGIVAKVENCILIGELGGQVSRGGVELLENCVIVGKNEFAVLQEELLQSEYRDCVFISYLWENARSQGYSGLIGYIENWDPQEPYREPYYKEEELVEKENCRFLLHRDIELKDYTTWKMKQPGFDNFKAVNTYMAGQFGDVAESFWGAPNIAKAYELGLMKGESANSFAPNGTVTVAQTLAMAARLHSICTTGKENFVQSGVWYQTYVDYCKANAILKQEFADYNAPIKRRDFADIMAAALPAAALSPINDIGEIPDVAKSEDYAGAVYTLYRAGILTGNDAVGTFGPETSINRAAAAAILTRMADPTLRKQITL